MKPLLFDLVTLQEPRELPLISIGDVSRRSYGPYEAPKRLNPNKAAQKAQKRARKAQRRSR